MMGKYKFSFLILSIFVCAHAASIENGWEQLFTDEETPLNRIQVKGNKRYLLLTDLKVNFLQAMDFCKNIHMNLITIKNEDEEKIIEKILADSGTFNEIWTSGSRLLDGKTWIWLTTGDKVGYTSWHSGEPNNNDELCISAVKASDSLSWKDDNCDKELAFICERPIDEKRDVLTEDKKDWQNVFDFIGNSDGRDLLHFQGKNYYISQSYQGNYYESFDYCQALNMKLVSVNSKEENDILYSRIRFTNAGDNFWTAGTRILDNKQWLWLTNGRPFGYTNWALGEPNNVNDHCLSLNFNKTKGLLWQDDNCSSEFKPICEEYKVPKLSDMIQNDDSASQRLGDTSPGDISTIIQDGRKFHVSRNSPATQSEARAFCADHSMNLVDIKNAEENSVVAKLLPYPENGSFWTDGEKENDKWLWKSSKSPINYFNWAIDSPQNNLCLGLTVFGKYRDESCEKKLPFICESKSDENKTSKDNNEGTINVFMTNNLVTKDGTVNKATEFVSSQYLKVKPTGGYHITVDNNAADC